MSSNRVSAALLAAALSILAGCQHDAADTAQASLDTVSPDAAAPSPDPDFDVEGFSGGFSTEGVDLVIGVDGRYRLRESKPAGGAAESEGLWSLEPGSGQLLLVPHVADEPRRRYAMPSHDELAPEDGGPSLRRGSPAAAR
ncbi:hypothetical protein [Luteimonas arsenica]|uniref:hypothetical protein n=1 Tax=Luteimonas arsenica TaxID=1586242 RepID=UPI0010559B85|nr:hypothetical protein [Luteimonas arsenica]